MAGPLVLVLAGLTVGALLGGIGGALTGLLAAAGLMGGVAAAAAAWAHQVGRLLEREDALAVAPCPPGFSLLCRAVYRRIL